MLTSLAGTVCSIWRNPLRGRWFGDPVTLVRQGKSRSGRGGACEPCRLEGTSRVGGIGWVEESCYALSWRGDGGLLTPQLWSAPGSVVLSSTSVAVAFFSRGAA